MYGSKGRIGLIVPSNNTVVEREFNLQLPDNIVAVASRMWNTRTEISDLEQMASQAERAASELSTAHVDVVAFACTSGSFLHGQQWDTDLARRLEVAAGCPVVTTSHAVIRALRAFSVRRVVVGTPYPEDINERERRYLEEQGIGVDKIAGLGIVESVKIGHCAPEVARDLALSLHSDESDAVFISCTNFRTFDVIDELEQQIGKPIITSNQATLWQCLQAVHYDKPVEGCGSLLRERLTAGVVASGRLGDDGA